MPLRIAAAAVAVLASALFASSVNAEEEGVPAEEAETLMRHGDRALDWLVEQQVPNAVVPDPHPARRNLIISYRIDADDEVYPYLHGRSFVYDGAVTALALTMAERYAEAESVLLALSRQLREDGSLWFGMNTQNAWPSEDDNEGAIVRSGASAWVGYAAAYYLRARNEAEEGFSESDRVARGIERFARAIADHLLEKQILDEEDRRHGLITGGSGAITFSVNDSGAVAGDFDPAPVTWCSTEHNIDAYFFLRDLGALSGSERYTDAAELIRRGLLTLWRSDQSQFIQGVKGDGSLDTVLPLDTASWGSLFLRSAGETRRSGAALEAAQTRFQIGNSRRYRPYGDEEIYESDEVSRAVFDDPDKRWRELDIAWIEGSMGVAAALAQAGRTAAAIETMRAALEYEVEGGFRYASETVPQLFSTFPSAASTAWFVIAAEVLLDPVDRRLFWGGQ